MAHWKELSPPYLTFSAHGNAVVTCLLVSPRTQNIISASDDHKILVHNPRTGACLTTVEGHEGGIWSVAYHSRPIKPTRETPAPPRPHHEIIVSGSTDRTLRVWDLETGKNLHTFSGHRSTVRAIAIVKPTLVNMGRDATGNIIYEKWPKRTLIVSGSRDHTLRVWRLPGITDEEYHSQQDPEGAAEGDEPAEANPYHLRLLEGHDHAVRALAAHGRTIVSGSYDATVRVWDIITGECIHVLMGHTQKVYSVVLDHSRQQVCSGSMDGTVRVWSITTGQSLHTLQGHTSLVGLLSISSSYLVSAAADSTLRVWDPDTGACLHTLLGHLGAITTFQHDESKVISGSDGALKMWDIRDGTLVRNMLTNVSGVWQVAFGKQFCVAATNTTDETNLVVWDFGLVGNEDTQVEMDAGLESDDDE